jgi:hypothetical protein
MSIKFFCSCGKRLKARDKMAARRTICPACGNPVGIPSLEPTQRGTAAAILSPAERQARQLQKTAAGLLADDEPAPPSPREPALPLSSKLDPEAFSPRRSEIIVQAVPKKPRPMRSFWPEELRFLNLLYSLRTVLLILGLALLWTLLTGLGLLFWSDIISPEKPLMWLLVALVSFLVIGYSGGFFQSILCSALARESGGNGWPRFSLSFLKCIWTGALLPCRSRRAGGDQFLPLAGRRRSDPGRLSPDRRTHSCRHRSFPGFVSGGMQERPLS